MSEKLEVTSEEVERVRARAGINMPVAIVKCRKLVNQQWENVRRAPQEGKKVAWIVSMPFATLLTRAAGMEHLFHASFAPLCTARRHEQPLLDASHEYGYLPDACSYHRLHIGLLHLWDTGQIEKADPEVRIPKPDLVLGNRICTEHPTLGMSMARKAKCPFVMLDRSAFGCATEDDFRARAKLLERQMKEEAIPAIEKVTGRPFDYARLSELVARNKRVAEMRNQLLLLMENRPAPMSMFDLGIAIGAFTASAGTEEAEQLYSELVEEINDRVARGEGSVANEKFRIYWDGYTTWALLGTVMRILGPRGGLPIIGRYILGFSGRPELIDPERPIESLAYSEGRLAGTIPWHASALIKELVKRFSVNGAVMLSFVTCRMWNVGQHDIAEELEREFGIPSLIFECDMVDRAFIDEGRLKTRVEAFLEMIDARRG